MRASPPVSAVVATLTCPLAVSTWLVGQVTFLRTSAWPLVEPVTCKWAPKPSASASLPAPTVALAPVAPLVPALSQALKLPLAKLSWKSTWVGNGVGVIVGESVLVGDSVGVKEKTGVKLAVGV